MGLLEEMAIPSVDPQSSMVLSPPCSSPLGTIEAYFSLDHTQEMMETQKGQVTYTAPRIQTAARS